MKNNYSTLYFLPVIIITLLLFSCVPQKKAAKHQQEITTLDSLLMQYRDSLKELDAKRLKKQNDNEMDDTVSAGINKFIDKTYKEIEILVAKNSILVGDVEIDKKDWNQLKKTLALSQSTSKLINDKVSLINDLINRNTVIKLDQDVFFGPGKYTVSPSVESSIGNFFEPAAREIDAFIKKYPDFPLSLVITAKGYADATTIAEGSGLYKELKEDLRLSGKEQLTNSDLNQALSTKRAKSVIQLFQTFEKKMTNNGNNISHILFLHEGKGEALPNPKATDYKTDDPRRRVVLLFWGVFPD